MSRFPWVDVLVDCPEAKNQRSPDQDQPNLQQLFTYIVPPELDLQVGDVVQVPFNTRQLTGIIVQGLTMAPTHIEAERLKPVGDRIATGLISPQYWELLNRVADYYHAPLMLVIRTAFPPGLLGKSQRRIRLIPDCLSPKDPCPSEADPSETESPCPSEVEAPDLPEASLPPIAQSVLDLLRKSPKGDYTAKYIHQKITNAAIGIAYLIAQGWVESYLQPPRYIRPKKDEIINLIQAGNLEKLTQRQQEIIRELQYIGGETWLTDCRQALRTNKITIKKLEDLGYVGIETREVLRLAQGGAIAPDQPKTLNPGQAAALAAIQAEPGFRVILLHGVTGSGKTEVYLQAIAPCVAAGRSALVLVPEIGLTPQLMDRFRARFGDRVYVYHSQLSEGERYDTWRVMLNPQAQILIGTRSAVFAPLRNLGMIILDEEHDSSFKEEERQPTYHARTVAQWRAELENCPLILGSATPDLTTWQATQTGKIDYLPLPHRIEQRPLPPIEIIDMRRELQAGNRSIFSHSLAQALQTLKPQKKQGILFIPRRGYSTFVSCRSCGEVILCPRCDVSLSYHHSGEFPHLICHYCNHRQAQPPQCPACGSPFLKNFGSGTQRVMEQLAQQFPELRAIRFDSDTTTSKGAHRNLLNQFEQGEADLLVGTQMLTKGLDIAEVTLVGILAADGLLHRADYRASEQAFQLLTQVAGRAGRGAEPGRVILQTYSPDHPVVQAVQAYDYPRFAATTLAERQNHGYPPNRRLVLLRLTGSNLAVVQRTAELMAIKGRSLLPPSAILLGPAPAPVMRVNRYFHWHILLKFPPKTHPLPDFSPLRDLCPRTVNMSFNFDPLNLG
ncbi:primosomal protein N' [Spirulina sp. CCNP1310]|uniref:primosomal protein N' n=1 Tax=Spirulina sp. CCNP1310 TaxID=3110249 RepID=UPI002B21E20E|nr:primosomal protein N' [Spirulina sp. CCNP1310]MEA5419937.1 primosomal protein N' [Spirulina sp. CCNP1310]